MNRKMVFFLVLVFAVLAFAFFKPYSISAAGPKQYKVIKSGIQESFEQAVSAELNNGWSPVGGVSFNSNDRSYLQALVK